MTKIAPHDPEDGSESWDLSQFLTYRIARLNALLNLQATRLLEAGHGLTLGQWRVIVTIGAGHARTSRQLFEMTQMDPALISRLLRQLEELSLLRTKRSTQDRRILEVSLTDEGVRVFQETFPIMEARQRELAGRFSAAELAALDDFFERLLEAAKKDLLSPGA